MLELADTSAWHVSRRAPDLRVTFDDQLKAGEVATCDMVKLELLRGARNPDDFVQRRAQLDLLPQSPIGPAEWRRALDVYEEVCRSGPGNDYHRGVSHPDLLIAAAAEAAGVSLVHYDEDFDTIASVTGQPMRWLAPRGSL